jgi:hypothetical protein
VILRSAQDDGPNRGDSGDELLVGRGETHDVDVGEAVEPAGGLGVGGVDELDLAAFGVGEVVAFHDGDDDLVFRERGFDFGGGIKDEVVVGAGGDDAGVQDEGFVFVRAGEAGAGEDFGEQGAGVVFVGVAVGVVDVDGNLGHFEEVFDGEDGGVALEGDSDGFGGRDGRLHVLAGGHGGVLMRRSLRGDGEGSGEEGDGGEGEELHGDRVNESEQ